MRKVFCALRKRKESADALKKRMFFLEANAFIGRVFPRAKLNDDAFTVQIDVVEERSLKFTVGGGASSQPLSMGHAALQYAHFGRIPKVAKLSGSLGTLYSDLGLRYCFSSCGQTSLGRRAALHYSSLELYARSCRILARN